MADTNQFFDSKVSVFKLNSQDMSSHVKELSGLPGQMRIEPDCTAKGVPSRSLCSQVKGKR